MGTLAKHRHPDQRQIQRIWRRTRIHLDRMPDLHIAMAIRKVFPLSLYEEDVASDTDEQQAGFVRDANPAARRPSATPSPTPACSLQSAYPAKPSSKEDLFYYVYGLLHSPDLANAMPTTSAKGAAPHPARKSRLRISGRSARRAAGSGLASELRDHADVRATRRSTAVAKTLTDADYRVVGREVRQARERQRPDHADLTQRSPSPAFRSRPTTTW